MTSFIAEISNPAYVFMVENIIQSIVSHSEKVIAILTLKMKCLVKFCNSRYVQVLHRNGRRIRIFYFP